MDTAREDWIVSVDDHVIEPPEPGDSRVPAELPRQLPTSWRPTDGVDTWSYEATSEDAVTGLVARPVPAPGLQPPAVNYAAIGPPVTTRRHGSLRWTRTASSAQWCFRTSRASVARSSSRRTTGPRLLACRPTTTSSSTSGAPPIRPAYPRVIMPLWDPLSLERDPALRREGARRVFSRSSRRASGCRRSTIRAVPGTRCSPPPPRPSMPLSIHIGSSSNSAKLDRPARARPDPYGARRWTSATTAGTGFLRDVLRRFPTSVLHSPRVGIGWMPPLSRLPRTPSTTTSSTTSTSGRRRLPSVHEPRPCRRELATWRYAAHGRLPAQHPRLLRVASPVTPTTPVS